MIEKTFWNDYVRKALHQPPFRVANKVQDAFNKGLPDVEYCLRGACGKLELKYVPRYPETDRGRIPINVSSFQRRQLVQWQNAGGTAYVLLGVERDWYLLSPHVPDALTRDDLEQASILMGSFQELNRLTVYLESIV